MKKSYNPEDSKVGSKFFNFHRKLGAKSFISLMVDLRQDTHTEFLHSSGLINGTYTYIEGSAPFY